MMCVFSLNTDIVTRINIGPNIHNYRINPCFVTLQFAAISLHKCLPVVIDIQVHMSRCAFADCDKTLVYTPKHYTFSLNFFTQ